MSPAFGPRLSYVPLVGLIVVLLSLAGHAQQPQQASHQQAHPQCPTGLTDQPFDIKEVEGEWYTLVRSPNLFPRTKTCQLFDFDKSSGKVTEMGYDIAKGTTDYTQYADSQPEAGKPIFRISLNAKQGLTWRVATYEKNKVMGIYACSMAKAQNGQTYPNIRALVLTKERDYGVASLQLQLKKLERMGIRFIVDSVWQAECEGMKKPTK